MSLYFKSILRISRSDFLLMLTDTQRFLSFFAQLNMLMKHCFGKHRRKNIISDLLLFFSCAEIFILHRFYVGSNKVSLSDMIFFKAFSARMNLKQILN